MGLLDRKEGWGSRWGSKSAGGLFKEKKFDQKRVEPPMKRLPYFHSQAFAVGLAVEGRNDRSSYFLLRVKGGENPESPQPGQNNQTSQHAPAGRAASMRGSTA